MDDKKRQLDRLLGTFESQRKTAGELERSRAIERQRVRYRFAELRRQSLLPALRQLMQRLERAGHFTRLRELDGDRILLDVLLQAQPPRRGRFELALDLEAEALSVSYNADGRHRSESSHHLTKVDDDLLTEKLLAFFEALTGLG